MAMSAAPEQLYDTLAPIPPVVRALLLGFGDHSRVDVQYGAEESDWVLTKEIASPQPDL